jgi:hypothetical protein
VRRAVRPAAASFQHSTAPHAHSTVPRTRSAATAAVVALPAALHPVWQQQSIIVPHLQLLSMKRKFSFNLAPVVSFPNPDQHHQALAGADTTQKIASRSDLKRSPEPTPSQLSAQSQAQSQSHRRHASKDSVSDYTPYISRRTLDAQTERELRAACRLVLQNFKPSDHGMDDVDPKLDFGALQYLKVAEERAKMRHAQQAEAPKVRMPTGAPVDLKTALEARGLQQTDLTLKTSGATPVRANSSRKRSEFGWLDDRDDKREEYLRKYVTTSLYVIHIANINQELLAATQIRTTRRTSRNGRRAGRRVDAAGSRKGVTRRCRCSRATVDGSPSPEPCTKHKRQHQRVCLSGHNKPVFKPRRVYRVAPYNEYTRQSRICTRPFRQRRLAKLEVHPTGSLTEQQQAGVVTRTE